MPAAIGFVLTGLGTLTGAAAIGAQIGSMIILGAVSKKLGDRAAKKASSQQNSGQREFSVRATDAYENFVYGKAMVPGATVYNNAATTPASYYTSNQPNNRYYHVFKFVGHRVSCLEYFRFDDRYLYPAVDSITWNGGTFTGSGAIQTGEFKGYINGAQYSNGSLTPTYFRWYNGAQTSADHWLKSFTSDWLPTAIGKDRAYGVLEISQINDQSVTDVVYRQGFPQNVFAFVHGAPVFDPRRYSLIRDPQFGDVSSGWFLADTSALGSLNLGLTASDVRSMTVRGVGGLTNRAIRISSATQFASELVSIHPHSYYTFQARARQTSGTNIAYLLAAFYTDAGTLISGVSDPNGFGGGTYHYWGANGVALAATWSLYQINVGSGFAYTIPTSARYVRLGALACYSGNNRGVQEFQELKPYRYGGNEQLAYSSSNWGHRQNPALAAANYLCDEQFGFGRESRQKINSTRYALNSDPCWRRYDTLYSNYWSDAISSGGSTLGGASIGSVFLGEVGAPAGRRALLLQTSGGSLNGRLIATDAVPIDPSGVYTVRFHAKGNGGSRITQGGYEFLDANGANIGGGAVFISGAIPATWSTYLSVVGSGAANTIPTSARFLKGYIFEPQSWGANTPTDLHLQEFQIQAGSYIKQFIEPWEQIDWSSVSSAAAWCDEPVSTPSGTQARFTCNGMGTTGATYADNLREIAGSGNLRVVYSRSGWLFFGGWHNPNIELNAADIVGPLEYRAAAETNDRFNTVRTRFYDREQDYKMVPGPTVKANEYIARDNSMQLFEDVDLPYTNDWFVANRIAFGMLEQGDNQGILKTVIGGRGHALQVGKQFALSLDVLSWSPKYFMLTEMPYDVRGSRLVAREDFAASYVDPTSAEYVPRSYYGVSSVTPAVPQVSSVTVAPRIGAIQLRWVNPANRAFEWIQVWANDVNSFGNSRLVKTTRDDEFLYNTEPLVTQYFWLRTVDFMSNVSSPYASASAAATVPTPADGEYVFFEEFNYRTVEEFEQRWQLLTGSNGGITFPTCGVLGGRVLQASGSMPWYTSRIKIPYDGLREYYQMEVRVKNVNSVTNQFMYAGFTCYRADGSTYINVLSADTYGSQHYMVAAGYQDSPLGEWRDLDGIMAGHMPWPGSGTTYGGDSASPGPINHTSRPLSAGRAHDLTRYISPMFLLNYDNRPGIQQIDSIRVKKLNRPNRLVFDPWTALNCNWVSRDVFTPSAVSCLDFYGTLVGPPDIMVGGRNAIPIDYASSKELSERFRPGYHTTIAPKSGSLVLRGNVWVGSTTSPNTFALFGGYEVICADGFVDAERQGVGQQFVVAVGSRSGWVPFEVQANLGVWTVTFPNSRRPPYYLKPLVSHVVYSGGLGLSSAYLSGLEAYIV